MSKLPNDAQVELLLGCAHCGKRFIDARSVVRDWRYFRFINSPITFTVGKKTVFICKQCYYKTIK